MSHTQIRPRLVVASYRGDPEVDAAIDRIAHEKGTNRGAIIRTYLENYLRREEREALEETGTG